MLFEDRNFTYQKGGEVLTRFNKTNVIDSIAIL